MKMTVSHQARKRNPFLSEYEYWYARAVTYAVAGKDKDGIHFIARETLQRPAGRPFIS